MRCNRCKRVLSVWACASIALLSGSAALAELPRHLPVQTLEATHEEIFPLPDEPIGLANQWLLVGTPYETACVSFGDCIGSANLIDLTKFTQ